MLMLVIYETFSSRRILNQRATLKSKGELLENVYQMKENIELKHLKTVVFEFLSHKDLNLLKYQK